MLRQLLLALSALALVACKHPLVIQGEGNIVERLLGERGCTLEEFQASDPRCTDNDVVDESYTVQYEAVPRPGWETKCAIGASAFSLMTSILFQLGGLASGPAATAASSRNGANKITAHCVISE